MSETYSDIYSKLQEAIGEESRLLWEHKRAKEKVRELRILAEEKAQEESKRLWAEAGKARSREEGLSLLRQINDMAAVEITPTPRNTLAATYQGESIEPEWLQDSL